MSYFVDDGDIKSQAKVIYSRGNMTVCKFSNCSLLDVKNQLFIYLSVVCTVAHSIATFNMTRVAYN